MSPQTPGEGRVTSLSLPACIHPLNTDGASAACRSLCWERETQHEQGGWLSPLLQAAVHGILRAVRMGFWEEVA